MNSSKILLFIPCYNCSIHIVKTLKNVKDNIYDMIDEIILVDNGSTDKTIETIKNYLKNTKYLKIKLLVNKNNYSLGGSHKVAFNYALKNDFSHVITIHGDNQGDAKDICNILNDKEYINFDCIFGARFHKNSKLRNYSKLRIIGNIIFNTTFSLLLFKKILDIGAGINIYNKSFFQDQSFLRFPNSLMFNPYLHFYAILMDYKIKFFPIDWSEEGQVSNVKFFREVYSLLKLICLLVFYRKSLIKNNFSKNIKYKYDIIV